MPLVSSFEMILPVCFHYPLDYFEGVSYFLTVYGGSECDGLDANCMQRLGERLDHSAGLGSVPTCDRDSLTLCAWGVTFSEVARLSFSARRPLRLFDFDLLISSVFGV